MTQQVPNPGEAAAGNDAIDLSALRDEVEGHLADAVSGSRLAKLKGIVRHAESGRDEGPNDVADDANHSVNGGATNVEAGEEILEVTDEQVAALTAAHDALAAALSSLDSNR